MNNITHEENNEDKFSCLSDEDVIKKIRHGDLEAQEFLFDKYKYLVKLKSRTYFLMGADKEDIIQEGMIGFYKAIRDYQPKKNNSFKGFAELCITRQIISAIKASNRQKHIPLNSYISLNKPISSDEENEDTYIDLLKESENNNPETVYIGLEQKAFIEQNIKKLLSTFESKVLEYYLQGKSYAEISVCTNKPEKSIDNALQRIKKKIEKFLSNKYENIY